MTDADRSVFLTLLQRLALTFSHPIDDGTLIAYFDALKDLEVADLDAAARHHCQRGKFWPVPAELREHAEALAEKRRKYDADHTPVEPVYRRLSEGDRVASPERIAQFWADMRAMVKAMPGPERRPHGRKR